MTPENLPLTTRTNVPFKEEYEFVEEETPVDLTGCSGAMQVREYGGAPDPPAIDLANVSSDVEGVWISDPTGGIVQVAIDEATLEAAYVGQIGSGIPGSPVELVYDLVITWPDGFEEVFLEGTFTIEAGVTD